ncbi:MAG: hypothetical protein HKN76_03770 [Saprospiraceae bacterium]|nr:hypothetical protein [Saprospiraceae bacterium]
MEPNTHPQILPASQKNEAVESTIIAEIKEIAINRHIHIMMGAGGLSGPEIIQFNIPADFDWPDDLSIRIDLIGPDGEIHEGLAWLSEKRLRAAIPVMNQIPSCSTNVMTNRETEFNSKLNHLLSSERIDKTLLAETLELLYLLRNRTLMIDPDKSVRNHKITFSLFYKDKLILNRESEEIMEKNINWDRRILDITSPYFLKMPRESVQEILEEIRNSFCLFLGPFSPECLLFGSYLDSDPPKIKIECDLNNGRTAGMVTEEGRLITFNGSYFLCGDCLEGIVLHELSHVYDHLQNKFTASKRYSEASVELEEALAEQEIIENEFGLPTPNEWRRRRDAIRSRIRSLREECDLQEIRAIQEKMESECRALFHMLHFYSRIYVGEDCACSTMAVKGMIAQLVGFWSTLPTRLREVNLDALKTCLTQIKEWIDQVENEKVKTTLSQDQVSQEHDESWTEYLDRLIQHGP